jgi:hypothetical protein
MSEADSIPDDPPEAPGDWTVDRDICMGCCAPPTRAPDLMAFSEVRGQCYFKRQPRDPDEIERACRAASVSCCQAVRYRGADPSVSERIRKLERSGIPRSLTERLVLALLVLASAGVAVLLVWGR